MRHFMVTILLVMLTSCGSTKKATLKVDDKRVESLVVGRTEKEQTTQEVAKQVYEIKNIEVMIEDFAVSNDSVKSNSPLLTKRTIAKINVVRNEQHKDSISVDKDIGTTAEKQLYTDTKIDSEMKKSQPIGGKVFILLIVIAAVIIIVRR